MKIRDVMTHGVEAIQSSETVSSASKLMRDLDVGALPVFEGNREVGIVTDRDIIVRVIATGLDPYRLPVKDIMTRNPIFCSEEAPLSEAAHIMETNRIRRLLVRDTSGNICGIVSLGDLAVRGDHALSEEILERVSEPSRPQRIESLGLP